MRLSAVVAFSVFLTSVAHVQADDLLPPPESSIQTVKIEEEIARRRKLLKLHQGLGIATVALLAATTAVGQLNYDDVIEGKGTQDYQTLHRSLAIGSGVMFTSAGLAAYFAPTPFEKKTRLDTVTIHKWSMGLAAAAMVAQIVLGVMARDSRGTTDEKPLAEKHLVIGYTTLGLTTIGTAVLFF